MVLVGRFDGLSQPRGKFTSKILDMKMGRQSLFGKVLTAVQFRRPEDFVFSKIDLSADVRGPELIFDRIRMVGNPLVFHGRGTLNLDSEELDLVLKPNPKDASLVSLASPAHITGPLASPNAKRTKLPADRLLVGGLLAGLVNPALLILAFSHVGGDKNPCAAAVEKVSEVSAAH